MIRMLVRLYNKKQLQLLCDSMEIAVEYLQNVECKTETCDNCPARRVCKDLNHALDFLYDKMKLQ